LTIAVTIPNYVVAAAVTSPNYVVAAAVTSPIEQFPTLLLSPS
jgi:hypothetical protein